VHHLVLFTWRDGTTADEIAALEQALRALPGAIPQLRSYRFGADLGLSEGNATFAMIAECDDIDGYLAYRDHPEHQRVIAEFIRPIAATRTAIQIESP